MGLRASQNPDLILKILIPRDNCSVVVKVAKRLALSQRVINSQILPFHGWRAGSWYCADGACKVHANGYAKNCTRGYAPHKRRQI